MRVKGQSKVKVTLEFFVVVFLLNVKFLGDWVFLFCFSNNPSNLFLSKFQHPWSIAIVQEQNDGSTKLHCSGSILDEKRILTAAHCFVNNDNPESVDPRKLKILAGAAEPTNQVA